MVDNYCDLAVANTSIITTWNAPHHHHTTLHLLHLIHNQDRAAH